MCDAVKSVAAYAELVYQVTGQCVPHRLGRTMGMKGRIEHGNGRLPRMRLCRLANGRQSVSGVQRGQRREFFELGDHPIREKRGLDEVRAAVYHPVAEGIRRRFELFERGARGRGQTLVRAECSDDTLHFPETTFAYVDQREFQRRRTRVHDGDTKAHLAVTFIDVLRSTYSLDAG